MCRSEFEGKERVLRYTPRSVLFEHLKSELRARALQIYEDRVLALSLGGSV